MFTLYLPDDVSEQWEWIHFYITITVLLPYSLDLPALLHKATAWVQTNVVIAILCGSWAVCTVSITAIIIGHLLLISHMPINNIYHLSEDILYLNNYYY